MTRSAFLRATLLAGLGAPIACALGSCGARSPLVPGEEPCAIQGEERPCSDACGLGTQRCEEGLWQACEVETSARACRNACGSGQQSCDDGTWSECVVPLAVRPCDDACGTGTEVCEDGRWLECQVPVATRPCSDSCGSGQQTCRGGAWETCEVEPVRVPCSSICGAGEEVCEGGTWRACNAPQPKPPKLLTIVRDFKESHPDFELSLFGNFFEPGLVRFDLGPDDKPLFAGKPGARSVTSAGNFAQWYNDVPLVNQAIQIDLQLAPSNEQPGLFVFSDDDFFPIDDQLFGNERFSHNFHFTLEASTQFQYVGGEMFSFSGDDDMWVFINRRLAIDLGGIHTRLAATVRLDEEATRLDLTRGETYPLHFFFAERHTFASHFKIETSISEPGSCD